MRVAGHVPAFSTCRRDDRGGLRRDDAHQPVHAGLGARAGRGHADAAAPHGAEAVAGLDLDIAAVRKTIDAMAQRGIAIDPTLEIHEMLTENRDGQVPPGAVDYLDHMPIGYQRSAKKALSGLVRSGRRQGVSRSDREDSGHREDHARSRRDCSLMGTDTGGSFTLHRELEMYERVGMTPAEILRRATLDTARYMGQGEQLGSIEKGKLADFFLVPGDPTKDLKAIKTLVWWSRTASCTSRARCIRTSACRRSSRRRR